jgi:hypothetical protein
LEASYASATYYSVSLFFTKVIQYWWHAHAWRKNFSLDLRYYDTATSLRVSNQCQGCQMVCFKTQNHNLGVFFGGGSCNGKSWNILWTFGVFYGHWKYFMAIWFILWSFDIFLPVLIFCTKKNLATLISVTPEWRKWAGMISNASFFWMKNVSVGNIRLTCIIWNHWSL